MIRGVAATPANEDFLKTKNTIFSIAARTVMTYDISLPTIQL